MNMAIRMEDVGKKIKGRQVIEELALNIPVGSITGIIGHNGSGKSMLFRLISGLVKPTTGIITVLGKQLHQTISFPENLSLILEKPGFLEEYSGFDNLAFLAGIRGRIGEEQIKAAIARVGLDPTDKRSVKTYSLGMKQKLAIAQAIMEQPAIMLLDEPMNGLDEQSVDRVYHIIKEEQQRGATILLTSHHKADIEALCDTVYKMNDGRLSGPVEVTAVHKTVDAVDIHL